MRRAVKTLLLLLLGACASIPREAEQSWRRCFDQGQFQNCRTAAETLIANPEKRALAWQALRYGCEHDEMACEDAATLMARKKWPDHVGELVTIACQRPTFTIWPNRAYCEKTMAGYKEQVEADSAVTEDARKALCARGNGLACDHLDRSARARADADRKIAEQDAAILRKPLAERRALAEAECKRTDIDNDAACYKVTLFRAGADPDQQGALAFLDAYMRYSDARDSQCVGWHQGQLAGVRASAEKLAKTCEKEGIRLFENHPGQMLDLEFPSPFSVSLRCGKYRKNLEYEGWARNNAQQMDQVTVKKQIEEHRCMLFPADDWNRYYDPLIRAHCRKLRGQFSTNMPPVSKLRCEP